MHEERNGTKGTLLLVIYISDPHLNLVPQEILVTAPELQEDGMVLLMFTYIYCSS